MVFWPVKYGWQAEHVLTVISFLVERVLMTLPQAQVMVASPYDGWISFFMLFFYLSEIVSGYYTLFRPQMSIGQKGANFGEIENRREF